MSGLPQPLPRWHDLPKSTRGFWQSAYTHNHVRSVVHIRQMGDGSTLDAHLDLGRGT